MTANLANAQFHPEKFHCSITESVSRVFKLKLPSGHVESLTTSQLLEIRKTIDRVPTIQFESGLPATLEAETITEETANAFGITMLEMKSRIRTERIAFPRQVAMYLVREICQWPFEAIGRFFGKDHGTIIYGHHEVNEKMGTYPEIRTKIEALRWRIERCGPKPLAEPLEIQVANGATQPRALEIAR